MANIDINLILKLKETRIPFISADVYNMRIFTSNGYNFTVANVSLHFCPPLYTCLVHIDGYHHILNKIKYCKVQLDFGMFKIIWPFNQPILGKMKADFAFFSSC